MKEGDDRMKIERTVVIETSDIQIGDRIHVGKYTATCQEVTQKSALFLLDQYLDDPMPMNWNDTNKGGYSESDLRKELQSEEVLNIFADIRDRMVPFENGDLLRIPFAGEIYGDKVPVWYEPDGHKQWPLMKDEHNRFAERRGAYEYGWLQNKDIEDSTSFCITDEVYLYTEFVLGAASETLGVRPVFIIKI